MEVWEKEEGEKGETRKGRAAELRMEDLGKDERRKA